MDFLDKVYVINLDKRTDRLECIIRQLNSINVPGDKIIRFSAIEHQNGAVGCGLSHIQVLKNVIKNGYKHVLILEDDIEFTVTPDVLESSLTRLFENEPNFDVCLLAYNLVKHTHHNDYLIRIHRAHSASAFILSSRYAEVLLPYFENAVSKLSKQNAINGGNCIDVAWCHLQERDNWFGFIPRFGKQTPGYSDILKKHVDYKGI